MGSADGQAGQAPLSAGEIAARFGMSQPVVSKHLAVLEGAVLVLQAVCPPSRALKAKARGKKGDP